MIFFFYFREKLEELLAWIPVALYFTLYLLVSGLINRQQNSLTLSTLPENGWETVNQMAMWISILTWVWPPNPGVKVGNLWIYPVLIEKLGKCLQKALEILLNFFLRYLVKMPKNLLRALVVIQEHFLIWLSWANQHTISTKELFTFTQTLTVLWQKTKMIVSIAI